jgi:hypothetical protein
MENKPGESRADNLPPNATEFIRQVVREMGYHKKARQEVEAELTAHFEDELRRCPDAQEREKRVFRLIEQFGDAKLLAVLCRRGKKRCRPLWAKAMVRSLQAMGVLVLLLGVYVLWFVSGKPSIKVDYLALLNQMNRPDVAEQDNAWPYYERAMALVVTDPNLGDIPAYKHPNYPEYRDFAALTEDAQRTIAQWIEANQAAWEQFVTAGAKPYCARSYRYAENRASDTWLMNVRMPHLSSLRDLSTMGLWLSRLRMMEGRSAEAVEACLAIARAGRHWQRGGMLIEQLVGTALAVRGHDELLAVLRQQKSSATELARLQRELAALYPQSYPSISLEEERLFFLDTVQHLFTEGGPGGGHLIPARARDISVMGGAPGDETVVLWKGLAFIHAGRDQTVAKAREIFDLQTKFARMSPYERRTAAATRADLAFFSRPQSRYALIRMLVPTPDRPADQMFRAKALHEATLAIVALRRYRLEKGSYPAALDELKQAGYLEALPSDPYSNRPLTYGATGDDFTLYSVGPDFVDNGGTPGTDSKGRRRLWADQGDTVFWPAP